MVIPKINNTHWAVKATILLSTDEEPFIVSNRVSQILSIDEVVNYVLTTRGDFLKLAVIIEKPEIRIQ